MICDGCGHPVLHCHCVLMERVRLAEKREGEAIQEAYNYRLLWQAAASYINSGQTKPRGEDEKKMISIAKESDTGKFWSGKTKGWL